MKNDQKLPLYHKIYQLLKFLYRAVENFEKQYKYSLGEEIVNSGWQCLDLVLETNKLKDSQKYDSIKKLSVRFDQLKARLRMAQETDQLSEGQYAHLQTEYIKETGKMIGGWLEWSREKK